MLVQLITDIWSVKSEKIASCTQLYSHECNSPGVTFSIYYWEAMNNRVHIANDWTWDISISEAQQSQQHWNIFSSVLFSWDIIVNYFHCKFWVKNFISYESYFLTLILAYETKVCVIFLRNFIPHSYIICFKIVPTVIYKVEYIFQDIYQHIHHHSLTTIAHIIILEWRGELLYGSTLYTKPLA